MVNELNIKITKAVVTRISVELDFDTKKPSWTVSGKLVTSGGMPVSDFTFMSDAWSDKSKIEAPLDADYHGKELFLAFTPAIMEKLGAMFKKLPEGK